MAISPHKRMNGHWWRLDFDISTIQARHGLICWTVGTWMFLPMLAGIGLFASEKDMVKEGDGLGGFEWRLAAQACWPSAIQKDGTVWGIFILLLDFKSLENPLRPLAMFRSCGRL